jgi:drug/metabolite transporter (DMT)-like permease
MDQAGQQKNIFLGVSLAVIAAFIWSGNFIIARRVHDQIPPIGLNFYRWLLATVIIAPFAIKKFIVEWPAVKRSWHYLFWVSLSGVSLFNTFVYIAGHYTTAINLALIGTTSSPIMAIIMARIFLKEKISLPKLSGMILCIAGVLILLSKGNFDNLLKLKFSTGDIWMLLAAFSFAVYNTLVKKKPAAISPVNFLFSSFLFGCILMLPFFIWETANHSKIEWSESLFFSVFYLALGASVICFFIWNKSISILGAGRTILFGNLIPIFSSILAVVDPQLHEKFTWVHFASMITVFLGLLLANLRSST